MKISSFESYRLFNESYNACIDRSDAWYRIQNKVLSIGVLANSKLSLINSSWLVIREPFNIIINIRTVGMQNENEKEIS